MSLDEFRRKEKKCREIDLVKTALRLRKTPPSETLEAAAKLNAYALKMTIASIKRENCGISEKELLEKLRQIYLQKTCSKLGVKKDLEKLEERIYRILKKQNIKYSEKQ